MKPRLIATLVTLYPERWRNEYGQELAEVLGNRPLGFSAILNVLMSAGTQQLRTQQPWLLVGIPHLIWIVAWLVASASIGPVLLTRGSPTYASLLFLIVGFWTVIRHGRAGGRAAMKLNLLICSPMLMVGLFAVIGAIRLVLVGPGHPSPSYDWRVSLLFYDAGRHTRPELFQIFLIAPLLQVPFAGVVGWCGGLAGRLVRHWLNDRPQTVS